jgi:hypothetical protein
MARAMLPSQSALFVAGPPDVLAYPGQENVHPYSVESREAVRELEAALQGERGAVLLVLATGDGARLAEYRLDAPPEWDGMAAAYGRLVIACRDGRVRCYGGQ